MTIKYELPPVPNTLLNLRAAILCELKAAHNFAIPLRHITRRFSTAAGKLKVRLPEVLNDMQREELLGIYRFQNLDRTFVFEIEQWKDILADEAAGIPIWDRLETSLRELR